MPPQKEPAMSLSFRIDFQMHKQINRDAGV